MTATRDVLTHLDFKKANELQNALVHKLAEAPAAPVEGQVYYDTATHKLYYRSNSAWVSADGSAIVAGNALTRTGDTLDVAPGTGLEISADTIRIAAAAAGEGLTGGAGSALAVNAGTGIEVTGDAVRIAAAAAGAGLTGGAGSALAVGAGTGITVNADDVAVNTTVIATKEYVDSVAQGLDAKASCVAATTVNIVIATALNNGDVLDGVTLATGDRVLVKDQTTKKENGIWEVAASPARTKDADANGELSGGTFVFVEQGTVNADSGWVISTNGAINPGTTEHEWVQFSGAGQITAGEGLTKTGNTIDVGAGEGIKLEADKVKIDTAVVPRLGASNIFTDELPMVVKKDAASIVFWAADNSAIGGVTGEKEATRKLKITGVNVLSLVSETGDIWLSSGGDILCKSNQLKEVTDPTAAQDAATKNYVDGRTYSASIGNGVLTEITVEHKLNSEDVDVTVRYAGGTKALVDVAWAISTADKIILYFNTAPAENALRVKVSK